MADGMDAESNGDEELGRLAGRGDEAAFAELYRRYFPSLYDYALRVSRDREVAALVVQASFLAAYSSLGSLEPQAPFELVLFGSAHRDLPGRMRGRRGTPPEVEEAFAEADPERLADSVPAENLSDLAPLVWAAAEEMRTGEYELLDLSARQKLDHGQIATVLRTRPEAVETKLARASSRFDAALSARVLLSHGRRACVDLDFIVGEDDWSPALGRRIVRHLQSCKTCQATRQRYPGGSELLAALVPVSASAGWQPTILQRLQEAAPSGEVPPPPPPSRPVSYTGGGGGIGDWIRGFLEDSGPRGPLLVAFGGGILLIVLVLAALCGAGAFDGGDGATGTQTVTATTTTTTTTTTTVTATTTPTTTATPTGVATAPEETEEPLPSATPLPTAPPLAIPTTAPAPTEPAIPTLVPATPTVVPPTETTAPPTATP